MIFFLCDDDKTALDTYANVIRELCVKHSIECKITCYSNGESLIFDYLEQNFAGILFLDIRMPKVDGISVAEKLKASGYTGEIIFLTVSNEYFLPAFDVGAFNYILKDEHNSARFEAVFLQAVAAAQDKEQTYFLFTSGNEHRSIAIKSIRYFEVIKRLIVVHYDNQVFEFFSTLGRLEVQLAGHEFVRIHRSYLVAVSQIESVVFGRLTLRDGTELAIGRKYYPNVKDAFRIFADVISNK